MPRSVAMRRLATLRARVSLATRPIEVAISREGMRDRTPRRPTTEEELPLEPTQVWNPPIKRGGEMARFLSYGEDPLTFWALKFHLPEILEQLGDSAPTDQVLVIYRPSFGRQGRPKEISPGSVARAEFGEFDAIIGTPTCVYLIESKWSSSGEAKGELLTLRSEQEHRHQVFRWYLKTWRNQPIASWETFVVQNSAQFQKNFPGNKIAPPESKLADNLRLSSRS